MTSISCKQKVEGQGSVSLDITRVAEHVIKELPCIINPERNLQQLHDTFSAYTLFKKDWVHPCWSLSSRGILTPDPVFSEKGRTDLLRALSAMVLKKEFSIALYTCEQIIFTVGCINDIIFILDTHLIPEAIGSQGKGLLKYFHM